MEKEELHIPKDAIITHGIEFNKTMDGDEYIRFTKHGVSVYLKKIKEIDIDKNWVEISIENYSSILFAINFRTFIVTI